MYLENQFHAFYQPAAFMFPSVQQANLTAALLLPEGRAD